MILVHVIGARPQFIKLAPLLRSFKSLDKRQQSGIKNILIHTGQHYDDEMSSIFFRDLQIPEPDYNLGVGSGSHAFQTGEMLHKIEGLLIKVSPDLLVIYGDTNSTLAGSLAAVKLHIPIAHVEAGLRSFNKRMPEEINRIISDHVSDILLAPTPTAMKNLKQEGMGKKSFYTGDIMYDAVLINRPVAEEKSGILKRLELENKDFVVVTIHRAENTENVQNLKLLFQTLAEIASPYFTVVFPIHPRTKNFIHLKNIIPSNSSHLKIIEPVGYFDMLKLVSHCQMILTDSGGLQKEAYFLNRPCITLREETEWAETITGKGNIITGINPDKIIKAIQEWKKRLKNTPTDFSKEIRKSFGDGRASEIIRDIILSSQKI